MPAPVREADLTPTRSELPEVWDYCVLYSDDRGVSRVYRMSFSDGTWRMWRDTPEFSQRFGAEVSAGQAETNGSWQKSVDGGRTWEHDFTVRYSRLAPP